MRASRIIDPSLKGTKLNRASDKERERERERERMFELGFGLEGILRSVERIEKHWGFWISRNLIANINMLSFLFFLSFFLSFFFFFGFVLFLFLLFLFFVFFLPILQIKFQSLTFFQN